MKITSFDSSTQVAQDRRGELRALIDALDLELARPCADCTSPCGCARRSPTCACKCSPQCLDAPRKLSSEGDRYPIEPGVVSLVFAFHTLRLVKPCWSCEGHGHGTHFKTPQLWFYADSALYPELISRYVTTQSRRLSTTWTVSLCAHQADPTATTFALMPILKEADEADLPALQNDLRTLANGLKAGVRQIASDLLRQLTLR